MSRRVIEVSEIEYSEILKMFSLLNREQQLEFLPKFFDKLDKDGLDFKNIDFILGDFLPYIKEK